jgi:hypothetical protein
MIRISADIPDTKGKHGQGNANQPRKKDQCRLKIEPILSKRPEQDDTDQKRSEVCNGMYVCFTVFHFLSFQAYLLFERFASHTIRTATPTKGTPITNTIIKKPKIIMSIS